MKTKQTAKISDIAEAISGISVAVAAALQLTAMAKRKPVRCVLPMVWHARRKRGRWLG